MMGLAAVIIATIVVSAILILISVAFGYALGLRHNNE